MVIRDNDVAYGNYHILYLREARSRYVPCGGFHEGDLLQVDLPATNTPSFSNGRRPRSVNCVRLQRNP